MKAYFYYFAILAAVAFIVSCSGRGGKNVATGTFEAREVMVSAEANGRLLTLNIEEGDEVEAGKSVGIIDTVQLFLRKLQLEAGLKSLTSSKSDVFKQIAVIKKQIETAEREKKRVAGLLEAGAATRKQMDDISAQVELLGNQLAAQQSTLVNANSSIDGQASSVNVQILQIDDMLSRCRLSSPINGIVIGKYLEAGEFAAQGRPVFKVADMEEVYMRAYLTSYQLSEVKLGEEVKVYADFGSGNRREYKGIVSWISDQSEFTPKTILTDDERANLVYAVKIRLRNDGYIKLGMYGEIEW